MKDLAHLIDEKLEAIQPSGSIIERDSQPLEAANVVCGETSKLCPSACVDSADSLINDKQVESAPDFFNAREPSYVLKAERPEHRVICYLAAQGNTATEIAQATGFTPVMVRYVEKQPWARKLIQEIVRSRGGDQVEMVLKGAALEAANHLIQVFKGEGEDKAPANVRAMCAKEVLDRVYGRSQQVVAHLNVSPEDLTDAELAKAVKSGQELN